MSSPDWLTRKRGTPKQINQKFPTNTPPRAVYRPQKLGVQKVEREKPKIRLPDKFKIKTYTSTGESLYLERDLEKWQIKDKFKLTDEEFDQAVREKLPVEHREATTGVKDKNGDGKIWEEIYVEKQEPVGETHKLFLAMPANVFNQYIDSYPDVDLDKNEILRDYVNSKIGTDAFEIVGQTFEERKSRKKPKPGTIDDKKVGEDDVIVLRIRYARE